MNRFLNVMFKRVDISQLAIFRIFFGMLMFLESWGAIATGWVKEAFVTPEYTFTFMGLEWTQVMLGDFMYFYYFLMGIMGILIMIGYRYTFACVAFFVLWGLSYLMQKSHYNNHYYLVWLISGFMAIIPANRYYSVDVKKNPELKQHYTSYWTIFIFQFQIALVYVYASLAKLYPGWLENKFLSIRLKSAAHWFRKELSWDFYANFLELESVQYFQVYAGIFFDLLVVPLLLFKRTRTIALIATLTFHLANSITLQIGIFPYFAIAFAVFFYPRKRIQQLFFKSKTFFEDSVSNIALSSKQNIGLGLVTLYFIIQVALPVRHWFIEDNVLWTEEGHRLSWRMMLRTKSTYSFDIEYLDPETKTRKVIDKYQYATARQLRTASSKPDVIWQLIQRIKEDFKNKGIKYDAIYAKSMVSVNGGKYYQLIDTNYDLKDVEWNTFSHQPWIMPCPDEYK